MLLRHCRSFTRELVLMSSLVRRIRAFVPAMRYIGAVALVAGLSSKPVNAQPMALEPGWSVRQVAGGFYFFGNFNGLSYDPISTDLFVTSRNTDTSLSTGIRYSVYRVTQAGVTTEIHFDNVLPGGVPFSYLAFDPVSRIIYFNAGGDQPSHIRKIDEFGNLIEDLLAPPTTERFTGMAFAPDGNLYLNSLLFGHNRTGVARYNETDDTFTTVYPAVGFGLNGGLSFDPDGNAYVAGGDMYKVNTLGVVSTIATLQGALGSAFGDGSVFTTSPSFSQSIIRVAPDGSGYSTFATGHGTPSTLHFADNGRLYVLDGTIIFEYSYVPEPASGIMVLGLGIAGTFRRQNRRQQSAG